MHRARGGTIRTVQLKQARVGRLREHEPAEVEVRRGPYRPWAHPPSPIKLQPPVLAGSSQAGIADDFRADVWYGSTLRPMLAASDPAYERGSGRETTSATAGRVVMYTGNWFAAFSTDSGRPGTWHFLNMFGFDLRAMRACCDQVVRYIPQIDRFVWLIQYQVEPNGENRHQLYVASPEQLIRSGAATRWTRFNVSSKSVGRAGQWLDFPELVVGNKDLYLSTNVFARKPGATGKDADEGRGGLVLRIPLSDLADTKGRWSGVIFNGQAGIRPAQFDPRQTDDRAYFVGNKTRGTYTVTSVPEGSNTFKTFDVDHVTIPDTRTDIPWLSRAQKDEGQLDVRVLGATRSGDHLWTATNEGVSSSNGLTRPGVHVSVIDLPKKDIATETILADPQYAFAYPKLVTNSLGQVGAVVEYGDQNTGLAVGVMRYQPRFVEVGAFVPVDVGVSALEGGSDYMDVGLAYPRTNLFAAAGYTVTRDTSVPKTNLATNPTYNVFGAAGQIPTEPPPPIETPPPTTVRQSSSIALTCPSGAITSGRYATVSGKLSPALSGQSIRLSFAGPNPSEKVASTAADGSFTTSVPTDTGSWTVTARWDGNAEYLDSSATCSYAVQDVPPPGKEPSSISLACPAQVPQYSTVSVSGALDPPDPGVQVGITFTIRADSGAVTTDSDFVGSEADGSYSFSYPGDVAGYYDFQASWNGDQTHAGSMSAVCTVHVIDAPNRRRAQP